MLSQIADLRLCVLLSLHPFVLGPLCPAACCLRLYVVDRSQFTPDAKQHDATKIWRYRQSEGGYKSTIRQHLHKRLLIEIELEIGFIEEIRTT